MKREKLMKTKIINITCELKALNSFFPNYNSQTFGKTCLNNGNINNKTFHKYFILTLRIITVLFSFIVKIKFNVCKF